jgi:hypothetical protein
MENQENFYKWLVKMGNIHTANNKLMTRAYKTIAENDEKIGKLVIK